jgi:hypothetical protein
MFRRGILIGSHSPHLPPLVAFSDPSDDNNTWNPSPPTLEHIMAIQGQLFQAMVLMQQTILWIQSTNERTQSRKRKNDTQGDASHTLDERKKKQLKISVAQQVDYDKQI